LPQTGCQKQLGISDKKAKLARFVCLAIVVKDAKQAFCIVVIAFCILNNKGKESKKNGLKKKG